MLIIPTLNLDSLKSIYDQFFCVHYIVWTFSLSLKVNVLYIYVKGHLIYVKFTCTLLKGTLEGYSKGYFKVLEMTASCYKLQISIICLLQDKSLL